jgi:hypothetical protein
VAGYYIFIFIFFQIEIMAHQTLSFLPKISASLNNKCNKISLCEETNPYVTCENESGWGGPNIDTSDIAFADVRFFNLDQTPSISASGIGTISGTTFTDVTHLTGSFAIGQTLIGPGIAQGTTIVDFITGTGNNNGGTYEVSIPQTVTSGTINGITLSQSYILSNPPLVDLYSAVISAPTPGSFNILTEASWSNPDGIYELVYTIIDSDGNTYTNEKQHVLFICNLCNCKENLIVKLVEACDAITVKKLKEQVDQMEMFIYGIKTAFSCGDFDTADAIIAAATTFCETILGCIGCGCGDK